MDINQIGIIGAGELGRALGTAFRQGGVAAMYYDVRLDRATTTIEQLVAANRVLLFCMPSWANKDAAEQVAKVTNDGTPRAVISFSKGAAEGFVTMDRILSERLPHQYAHGVVYGPMIAQEIAAGKLGAGVLALNDQGWVEAMRTLFLRARITLEPSGNLEGLAACGTLKNVYAIALGMGDGMYLGDNARGILAVMALGEMKQILAELGHDGQLADGLAGIGDLITTGTSEASFNYKVGKTIVHGGMMAQGQISEGLVTLKELASVVTIERYPLLNQVNQIAYQNAPKEQLPELIQRLPQREML